MEYAPKPLAYSRFEGLLSTYSRADRRMTEEELEEFKAGAEKQGTQMPPIRTLQEALEWALFYKGICLPKAPFDTEI